MHENYPTASARPKPRKNQGPDQFSADAVPLPDLHKLNVSKKFPPETLVRVPFAYDAVFKPDYPNDVVREKRKIQTCYQTQSSGLRGRDNIGAREAQFGRVTEFYLNAVALRFCKQRLVPELAQDVLRRNRLDFEELEELMGKNLHSPARSVDLSYFEPFLDKPLDVSIVDAIVDSTCRDFVLNGDHDENTLRIQGEYRESLRGVVFYAIQTLLRGNGGYDRKLPCMQVPYLEVEETLKDIDWSGRASEAPATRLIYIQNCMRGGRRVK